ncbi:HIT domain-containing protein [Anaerolineales bacterium HSG24]|nr:HIT domain-containing protein [Anaerolineales bacterium HSG24]
MTIERLYTPWRMKHVTSEKKSKTNCIFCDYQHADTVHDEDNLVLHRGEHTFTVMNLYPYNCGHVMILPYDHVATLSDTSVAAQCEIMKLATYYTELLGDLMHPDGFNLGVNMGKAAGAGIDTHLHFHVVPRWNGDSNFMPVLGNARILPEELDATYDKIVAIMRYNPPR